MAQNKTRPTGASVKQYLTSRASEAQRADCDVLMSLLGRITNQPPKMWGPSIVGFGSYSYTYDSGRKGESALAGFAVRGRDLVVYVMPEMEGREQLLSRLGKHRIGKSCLYFRQLADLDMNVFEQILAGSVAEVRRRYGQ